MITDTEKDAMIEKTLFGDSKNAEMVQKEVLLLREFREFLIRKVGNQEGTNLFADFIAERTETAWRKTADLCIEDRSLRSFISLFWGPLKRTLEYDEIWQDDEVRFVVKKCSVYESLRQAGLTDIGYHVFCMTDPAVVKAINPKIAFSRTKTLMQGDDCCDHCYSYRQEE